MSSKNSREYGKSMQRLQTILQNLDDSQIPLDELADQVLEASDLLKKCKKILTDTDFKVQQVLEALTSEFEEEREGPREKTSSNRLAGTLDKKNANSDSSPGDEEDEALEDEDETEDETEDEKNM